MPKAAGTSNRTVKQGSPCLPGATKHSGKGHESPTTGSDLKSVAVPDAFKAVFMQAQTYVEEYFAAKRENPREGQIEISGERYILVRAASMSTEFFDLVNSLYRDRGRKEARDVAFRFLFDIAHAIGKADAKSFFAKMQVVDPIARLSAGPIHFAHTGWAFVRILPESKPTPDENYLLIYDHPFSFEAHTWSQKKTASGQTGRTEFPVCIMNAGYSSGWCEESFGIPLIAVEIQCRSRGDNQCRFIMAPPQHIKKHITAYGQRHSVDVAGFDGLVIPEFFQQKRLEDELRQHRDQLEELVNRRTAKLTRINRQLSREIADRRQAKKALLQSETMLEAIIDQTFQFIGVLKLDGTVVKINKTGLQLAGVTAAEIIGRPFWHTPLWTRTAHPVGRLISALQTASEGGLVRFESDFTIKDTTGSDSPEDAGRRMIFDFSLKPFRDESGRIIYVIVEGRDITELRMAMQDVQKREKELQSQSRTLAEANIALKVVLKQVEEKSKEDRETILANVKQFVHPFVNRLKAGQLKKDHLQLVHTLEANLNNITSPLITKLTSSFINLTPMEIRIAHMVKEGLTNKEIAQLLGIATNTISSHRFRIRSKLGLKNKGANLRSYLLALENQ